MTKAQLSNLLFSTAAVAYIAGWVIIGLIFVNPFKESK